MKGILYVVGGPIGNLEDITLRALRVLKEVDLVVCEDTRRTRILLDHYGIKKKLLSLYEYNEEKRIPTLLQFLQEGTKLALLSDAGTPCISDPGARFVRASLRQGVEVQVIPGPSAITAALSVAGFPADRFLFEGFLPKKKGKRLKRLRELVEEERTVVLFETPHRLEKSLEEIFETLGPREVTLLRELTKRFEEILLGNLDEIRDRASKKKGEMVLVIGNKGFFTR